jgi:energy-coupling factor transporter ATP-binding protein EcfA2
MSRQQPLYLKHYGYLLQDPEIFEIFFPGTARSTRESKHNDVIIISGKKGSGETELAKMIAHIYHKEFPRNRVIIFCGIKGLYDDLPWATQVDLDEVAEEEAELPKNDFSGVPNVSEFRNSLVIFDNTERHPNPKVERILYQLVNVIAMNGRRLNSILT